jgi:hypothetical protein
MPMAIFRITQVDGQDTDVGPDPYIQMGFYSHGLVGTSRYANEPVHLIAAARRSGYPGMRWMLLEASRLRIGAVLHTESYDFMIASGQLVNFKVIGSVGMQVLNATINVQSATSVTGGSSWHALQRYQVTREADKDEGIVDDVRNLRGRKLAGRIGGWVWDQFF